MKNLANVFFGLAILLIGYAVIGRLMGMAFINFGIAKVLPSTCLSMANSLMLIAILTKLK